MKKIAFLFVAMFLAVASFAETKPIKEKSPEKWQAICKAYLEQDLPTNAEVKEIKVTQVAIEMCIYEVTYVHWIDFGNGLLEIVDAGSYTITAPCPEQGFNVCLPVGAGMNLCL